MVWIKRLSLLVAGLLAVVAILLAYVMLFVNPNDFKDELKSVALEKPMLIYAWMVILAGRFSLGWGLDWKILAFP